VVCGGVGEEVLWGGEVEGGGGGNEGDESTDHEMHLAGEVAKRVVDEGVAISCCVVAVSC
jgi:hypothetical protein